MKNNIKLPATFLFEGQFQHILLLAGLYLGHMTHINVSVADHSPCCQIREDQPEGQDMQAIYGKAA